MVIDMATGNITPVFVSQNDQQLLLYPTFSPRGNEIAAVLREKSGEEFVTRGLIVIPATQGGVQQARFLTTGDVSEPSWSRDGEMLAFVKGGDIWTVRSDGSGEKNITGGKGRFRTPLFSPQ
jgi:Tol biopolymer transport system component